MTMPAGAHPTHVDPRLSRYDPLQRVIYFDDFDCWMSTKASEPPPAIS